MTPRQQIQRRIELMRMVMSEAPRRFEPDAAFTLRIAEEIERLARRILDGCAELRGGPPRVWRDVSAAGKTAERAGR